MGFVGCLRMHWVKRAVSGWKPSSVGMVASWTVCGDHDDAVFVASRIVVSFQILNPKAVSTRFTKVKACIP